MRKTPDQRRRSTEEVYMIKAFLREENGQDLIEYVLVVAIIAFAAAVGMGTVAAQINTAFAKIGVKMNAYTS